MKQNMTTWMTAFALALGAGCSSNDDEPEIPAAAPRLAVASSATQALLAQAGDYRSWERANDGARTQSEGHSNMFVATFYNDVVASAPSPEVMPLPDGAIFVKEGYPSMDAAAPMALTLMHKTGSEWYWAQVAPDERVFVDESGSALEGTNVAMCVGCHEGVADNDMVFTSLSD